MVRAAVPLPPVTIARPRVFIFTSAADLPLITSRWNLPASVAVKSLTVRLPISGLMCRNTISVGWRGEVYDCDFNQQLGMQWSGNMGDKLFLWDIDPNSLEERAIMTGDHCFGCTAGAGSSCGGAIRSLS